MKHFLSLTLLSLFVISSNAQYALQFGAAVAADDGTLYVGEGRNLLQSGSVFMYRAGDDGTWNLDGTVQASDGMNAGNGFGRSIAIHENMMVVGASLTNAVYVFERSEGGAWMETARLSQDATGLGSKVATNGMHIVATAGGNRNTGSSVHSWTKGADGWVYNGELPSSAGEGRTGLGSALAIQGDVIAVGSPFSEGRKGMVETYAYADGVWTSQGVLERTAAEEGDSFGSSILMAGPHMAIGMPGHDIRKGAVAIFVNNEESGKWDYDRKLEPFDSRGNEQFGASITMGGGSVWIGAPGYGDQNGTVYQFQIDGSQMRMGGTNFLQPENLQYRSGFGGQIAVSGTIAVVGSQGHDNFEGAAFPFSMKDGTWTAGNLLYSDSGVFESVTGDVVTCEEEEAGGFPCKDVDMLSFLSRSDIGADRGIQTNDVWGWTDPETDVEWAIIGRTDGTSFVSLADPSNPIFVADLPYSASGHRSLHRDMKVYQNYAYIVADGAGAHHMQIFDLTRLRDIENTPETVLEDNLYKDLYSSHNLIINEESGFLYAVGSDSGGESCGGALHMIDLKDPANPTFAGCFSDPRTGRRGSGSTHDAQCVIYNGPDTDYTGHEICLSSNGTALSIADVTDKDNPVAISIGEYPNVAYAHQGWLTEDHHYFYLNDEGDEASELVDATRTIIFDLTDLDEPVLSGFYMAPDSAIDHNLYVKGNLMYQTNYLAGLRILDVSDPENPVEVGTFDTVPYGPNDNSPVLGAWSNYPFFKSGVIVVTSGREGVFFLKKKEIDT